MNVNLRKPTEYTYAIKLNRKYRIAMIVIFCALVVLGILFYPLMLLALFLGVFGYFSYMRDRLFFDELGLVIGSLSGATYLTWDQIVSVEDAFVSYPKDRQPVRELRIVYQRSEQDEAQNVRYPLASYEGIQFFLNFYEEKTGGCIEYRN